jgi:cyanophycinase-like exopeptidase
MIRVMTGRVALHGGGEFLPGDEPFLRALLEAAGVAADGRGPGEPIHVVVAPTAAARHNPDASSRFGISAFQRVADGGRPIQLETARVVDAASADDPITAGRLESADLVYLPGGDPDVIPTLFPGTAAWRAIESARLRGAVLAGASAGAMGLCRFTWTPDGIRPGLDIVHGLIVFPHADAQVWLSRTSWFAMASAAGVGVLGIGERTGVISPGDDAHVNGGTATWRVVGEHEVRWLPPGATEPAILTDGDTIALPA